MPDGISKSWGAPMSMSWISVVDGGARRCGSPVGSDRSWALMSKSRRSSKRDALMPNKAVLPIAVFSPKYAMWPDASVDVIFSTNVFEHVMDLGGAFRELFRVLRPGGELIASWGPLFYSPQGYHLYWATQVPWAHILCGREAIWALREARAPHPSARVPESWQGMGLNGARFKDYERAARESGFIMTKFVAIPVRGQRWATRIPILRDLMTFGVTCRIQKPL